jgi:WhiB family redox-sensing transcriptional regulator
MVTAGWTNQAACRDADPELFFPVSETATAVTYAKAVCALCPVRPACLQHAVGTGEGHGIWGGLTPDERRNPRRSRPARQAAAA